MFSFFNRWAERLYNKKIDAIGLAIFRVSFFLVFFLEVLHLFEFRHLLYDVVPYAQPADIDSTYLLVFWLIILVLLIFGAATRVAAIINYILTVHFMGLAQLYEYHMFHAYLIVSFLVIFIPVSRVMSFDAIWIRLKNSGPRIRYQTNRNVSVIAYYAIVFTGIGLVYFDSVFYKIMTNLWRSGLALWTPCSVPMAVINDNSYILNIKWLCIGLSHVALLFEAAFIFLFFRKKWRWPVFIIGLGLHLSILFQYPIPLFALGYVAMYLLIVPVGFWRRLSTVFKYNKPRFTFLFDGECPLCIRTVIVLEALDVFGAIQFQSLQNGGFRHAAVEGISETELINDIHVTNASGKLYKGAEAYAQILTRLPFFFLLGWLMRLPGFKQLAAHMYRLIADNRITERCTEDNCGYTPPVPLPQTDAIKLTQKLTLGALRIKLIALAMIVLFLLQANSTYNSFAFNALKKTVGLENSRLENRIQNYTQPIRNLSKVLWGITAHTVFLDGHFDGYNHILAVEYLAPEGEQNIWLPITQYTGQPGKYQNGPMWTRWSFRVTGPHFRDEKLQKGLRDYTAFWIGQTNHSFKDARFRVWVKYMDTPTGWEYNFLRNQMAKPWNDAGTVQWSNKEFSTQLVNIEEIR